MNNNQGRRRTRRVRQQRKQKNTQISRILLTVCMIALVAVVSIGGTIAWLTAQTQEITNTFTTSTIGVTLTESENLDLKMVPGKELDKDPQVTLNAGSEAGWLFVTVNEVFNTVTVEGKECKFSDYLTYTVDTTTAGKAWTALGTAYPGVYYIENPVAGTPYPVLTGNKVKVNENVTKEMMAALKTEVDGQEVLNYPKLNIKAYTIQKEGVTTATDAWAKLNP